MLNAQRKGHGLAHLGDRTGDLFATPFKADLGFGVVSFTFRSYTRYSNTTLRR